MPGTPVYFEGQFEITLDKPKTMDVKNRTLIISTLKNTSEIAINLKDLDSFGRFDDFWRIRLETLKLVLLDTSNNPLQSHGLSYGEGIQIRIRYPTVFYDTDFNNIEHSFLAQNFECNSDYSTIGEEIKWKSSCRVDEEFSQTNYKPSPNGIFNFLIENPERIDMERLAGLRIQFSGTRIRKK
eukprot:TRINITY_DN18860_c0_g1_i1.p1 TRINITY_DN18860_c0_g1~~TRINITY_DN18860_c0_g1_i1.p1  ORF type:complete len:215 (-),score=24.29 TRINITY_DN18860_c0_g1_i1:105-653(-)